MSSDTESMLSSSVGDALQGLQSLSEPQVVVVDNDTYIWCQFREEEEGGEEEGV